MQSRQKQVGEKEGIVVVQQLSWTASTLREEGRPCGSGSQREGCQAVSRRKQLGLGAGARPVESAGVSTELSSCGTQKSSTVFPQNVLGRDPPRPQRLSSAGPPAGSMGLGRLHCALCPSSLWILTADVSSPHPGTRPPTLGLCG